MIPPAADPGASGDPTLEPVQLITNTEFDAIFRDWVGDIERILRSRSGLDDGPEGKTWALVGIKRRGAALAQRMWKQLTSAGQELLYGEVDISLYRDDYHLQRGKPEVLGTEISFDVDGVPILLVDDVLFTGRTVRAAMNLLLDYGRPRVIQLATFVDRGHRELPIVANSVGREIPTERKDRVLVKLEELEGEDCVELFRLPA